ncbi:MAG: AAA family ATPase, partial [Chloroflexota bacterium]
MKISSIHLEDFKRFTNLTIENISETTKLVILVGSNGSGKSSLMEAFNFWSWRGRKNGGVNFQESYHWKKSSDTDNKEYNQLIDRIRITFHDSELDPRRFKQNPKELKKMFYFRSAYRHEANFLTRQVNKVPEIIEDAKS